MVAVITPAFARLLAPFDLRTLDSDASTILAVDRDLRITYVNAAYFGFAAANDAPPEFEARWGLGASLLDATEGPLVGYWTEWFRAAQDGKAPVQAEYECSSPALFRRFHLTAYPLGDKEGLLLVHSLHVVHPHDPNERSPANEALYRCDDGLVRQCSACRRVRRREPPERWDWVPEWVERQSIAVSHGLCLPCMAFHYPSTDEGAH